MVSCLSPDDIEQENFDTEIQQLQTLKQDYPNFEQAIDHTISEKKAAWLEAKTITIDTTRQKAFREIIGADKKASYSSRLRYIEGLKNSLVQSFAQTQQVAVVNTNAKVDRMLQQEGLTTNAQLDSLTLEAVDILEKKYKELSTDRTRNE